MRFVYSAEVLRNRWLDDFSDVFFKIESDYLAEHKIVLGHSYWRIFEVVLRALQCKRLSAYARADIVRTLEVVNYSPVVNGQLTFFCRDVMLRR